jgi:UDP:flavonoid glycosyltransferase YjiC (YdhE family)
VRILFSSTGAVGHFRSLTPFIAACAKSGEETLVAGPPWLASMAESGGYEFVAFDAPSREDLLELRSNYRNLCESESQNSLRREGYGRLRPQTSLPVLTEICGTWRPDVVIREAAEFGSALAAERHRVPVVRVSWRAILEEDIIRLCAEPLDELRRSLGLPADPGSERIRHSPRLTFWPASLEDSTGPDLPHTVRFRDPRWDEPAHKLNYEWGDCEGPLIYITFGTVTRTLDIASRVYATAAEALSSLRVRAVLTAGQPHGQPPPIAEVPGHVRAEAWVDEVDVLAEASVVVCHGGASSILGAAAAGLPMVLVPIFGDQPSTARLVSEFGAGVVAELDPCSIRDAIVQVLDDDTHRRRALALARELQTHAKCERVMEILAEVMAAPGGGFRG